MLIVGDLGATKTRLGFFERGSNPRTPLVEVTVPSADFSGLEDMIHTFISTYDLRPERAVFGVAGPVVEGRAVITNLGWVIEQESLASALGFEEVLLMNDLQAIAYGIGLMEEHDLFTLQEGHPLSTGTRAVIAPGTGLGEAFLTSYGSHPQVHASEGGHADFAPMDDLQARLLTFLRSRLGHVSYEQVCSGRGLPNIYDFLKQSSLADEPGWLKSDLSAAPDPTPVIVQSALDRERPCPICSQSLQIFVSILGAEAGNLALKVLATGGVYLCGGIPPRIIEILSQEGFLQSFRAKGRLAPLMGQIPVKVVLHPDIALIGAASAGLKTIPA